MTLALVFVGDWPVELRDAGERVLAAVLVQDLEVLTGVINLKLVDDNEITSLNSQYNGNAYATDVLTFNYRESGESPEELADVAISLDTAKRQADAAGIGLADEVGLLICHGILHTLGLDHQSDGEQARVEALQESILVSAGLKYRKFTWAN